MPVINQFFRQNASLKGKLLGTFLLMVGSLILVAGTAVALQLSAAQRAAVLEAQHMATEIATAAEEMSAKNLERLQHYAEGTGNLFDRDVMLLDLNGVIIACSRPAAVGTVYLNTEITQTMRDGIARSFIGPDIGGPGLAHQVVVPLPPQQADGTRVGALRGAVVFEYTQVHEALMREAWRAAALTGGAAGLLILLAWVLARTVTRALTQPLAEMEQAAAAIAAGDYGVRLKLRTHDELGRLTMAFNRMASDLRRSRATLEQRNTELAHSNTMLQEGVERHKEAAQRIEYLAYHDSLTGLPNRAQFSLVLSQAVERAKRSRQTFGVFFIDLDRFKQINDTLGHEAGDALLVEVAQRLRHTLRGVDTVARLGGDEFVVLVETLKHDKHAEVVARKILAAIARPVSLPGQELRVTASVGISRFARDGQDEQTLMKNADIAMYQVKESGKNAFAFYSAERNANSFERLALESSLRRALELGELQLHYQPKQDLRSGKVTGMEALLRWQHPDLGMVSPAQFIPVAEETGLIVPIGLWALRQACQQTVAWRAQGLTDLVVAVNLSPRQFSDDNLLGDIVAILQETGMDGRWLELEITESAIMQDAEMGRKLLRSLKSLGIRVAVDDFGTGYSSLSTLKLLPIDTLKIDRSFIRDLATDVEDRGLTEAIIQMAKTLNLHLVAEGVESDEQREFLVARGCDELQGYLFSKPLPLPVFERFVSSHGAGRLQLADLDAVSG
jgi:diguanylate cyclase (GGDEF)-like protein